MTVIKYLIFKNTIQFLTTSTAKGVEFEITIVGVKCLVPPWGLSSLSHNQNSILWEQLQQSKRQLFFSFFF